MNLNLNDPNNSIATFFGLMGEGTSRLFDIAVSFALSFLIALTISNQLSAEAQGSIMGAVITFGPAIVFFYWWYRRASADQRIRKAIKKAPDTTTVKQIRDAVMVQDVK